MNREVLDDGRWFDVDAAKCWDSRSSREEWLYRTCKGAYIREWWPVGQKARRKFEVLDRRQAFAWLLRNGYGNAVDEKFVEANEI